MTCNSPSYSPMPSPDHTTAYSPSMPPLHPATPSPPPFGPAPAPRPASDEEEGRSKTAPDDGEMAVDESSDEELRGLSRNRCSAIGEVDLDAVSSPPSLWQSSPAHIECTAEIAGVSRKLRNVPTTCPRLPKYRETSKNVSTIAKMCQDRPRARRAHAMMSVSAYGFARQHRVWGGVFDAACLEHVESGRRRCCRRSGSMLISFHRPPIIFKICLFFLYILF